MGTGDLNRNNTNPNNNLQGGVLDSIRVLRGATVFLSVPRMHATSHQITFDAAGVVTIPTPTPGQNGVTMTATTVGMALVTLYDAANRQESQFEVVVVDVLPVGTAAVTKFTPKFGPRVNKPDLQLVSQQPTWNPDTSKWRFTFRLLPRPYDYVDHCHALGKIPHFGALYDFHKEQTTGDGELTGWKVTSDPELRDGLYISAEFAPGAPALVVVGALAAEALAGSKKSQASDFVLVPVNGLPMPAAPVSYTLAPVGPVKPFSSATFRATHLTPGQYYKLATATGDLVCQPVLADLNGNADFQVLWPFDSNNIANPTNMTFGLYNALGTMLVAPQAYTSDTAWAGVQNLSVGRIGTAAVQVQADMDTNLPSVHIDLIKQDGSRDYIDEPDPTIAAVGPTTVAINDQLPGGTTLLVRLTSVPVDGHPIVENSAHSILSPIVLEKIAVPAITTPQTADAVGTIGSTSGARAGSEAGANVAAWAAVDGPYAENPGLEFATGWRSIAGPDNVQWWEYEFATAKRIAAIKLKRPSPIGGWNFPQRFLIQGSNNGTTYTTLRQPSDQTQWEGFENAPGQFDRNFVIPEANRANYKIYRIQFVQSANQPAGDYERALHHVTFYEEGFDPLPDFGVRVWGLRGYDATDLSGTTKTITQLSGGPDIYGSARGQFYWTVDGSDPLNPASARRASGPDEPAFGSPANIDYSCTVRYALIPANGSEAGVPVTGSYEIVKSPDWVEWACSFQPTALSSPDTMPTGARVDMDMSWVTAGPAQPVGFYTTNGNDPRIDTSNFFYGGFDLPMTPGTYTVKAAMFYYRLDINNPNSGFPVWTDVAERTFTVV